MESGLSANANDKKFVIMLAVAIVEFIVIVVLAVIVATKLQAPSEDGIVEEDSDSDQSSAIEYDDDGNALSMRVGCDTDKYLYDFFKNNTYEITDAATDQLIEDGDYTIAGTSLKLMSNSGKTHELEYRASYLTVGEEKIKCTEYNDA